MQRSVGEKAIGLARLPEAWTPTFVVIAADACDSFLAGSALALEEAAREVLEVLACSAVETLIVRSSAQAEGLHCRGQFLSKTCDASAPALVAAAAEILQDFTKERALGQSCALVVHIYLKARRFGHLSNERRVGKLPRDFLADIGKSGAPRVVILQAKKEVVEPDPNAPIPIQSDVESALRHLARWLYQKLGRVHIEWIDVGGKLVVVQCDSDEAAPLRQPMAAWGGAARPVIGPLRVFEPANANNTKDLRKTRALGIFQAAGLSTTPVYMLRNLEHIKSLESDGDGPSEALLSDLAELVRHPLVLRIDVLASSYGQWQNLPAKLPVRTVDEAVTFLRGALATLHEIARTDLAIVVHHFIPARAAAWSECNVTTKRVRIDATWGHPDGLQTFPCDTTYVDLLGDETTTCCRYKDEFLDIDQDGKCFPHRAAPDLALEPVLSSDDAANVARATQKVAEQLQKTTRVMWFLDTDDGAGVERLFPWIIDDCESWPDRYLLGETNVPREIIPGTGDHARRLMVGGVRRIESRADLDDFERDPKLFDLGGKRVVFRPAAWDDIRSKDFVRDVAQAALKREWKIVLEGSTLSHNYYLLRAQKVLVESSADFLSEPRRRRIFGKLVRDRVPESILARGEQIEVRLLANGELKEELLRKLIEESFEAVTAATEAGLFEELADVLEVLRALLALHGKDERDLGAIADRKSAKRGGFAKGRFLVSTGGENKAATTTRRTRYVRVEEGDGSALEIQVPLVPPDSERSTESASVVLGGTRLQLEATYEGDQVTLKLRRSTAAEARSAQQLNLFDM
jgi:predicted house-cleaning noncanonical NTP pyrophosphatase (MazG superfamily)